MVKNNGGEATFVRTDVTDSDDVAAMVRTALDEYGGLDFAHNNAGIADEGTRLAEYDEAEWDRMIDVNLKGVSVTPKRQPTPSSGSVPRTPRTSWDNRLLSTVGC